MNVYLLSYTPNSNVHIDTEAMFFPIQVPNILKNDINRINSKINLLKLRSNRRYLLVYKKSWGSSGGIVNEHIN